VLGVITADAPVANCWFVLQLWCLEEYWQYSLFNLAMILGFEATVTTTRRLNIQKLRGMGNKATTYVAPTWYTMANERARFPGGPTSCVC
jgi:hypothetical protein